MSRQVCVLLILSMLAMNSCTGHPRGIPISSNAALRVNLVMDLEVLRVWDGFDHSDDPAITHILDVLVHNGPADWVGKIVALPYNDFYRGCEPPLQGARFQASPADLVTPDPTKHGSPDRRRPNY